MSNELKVSYFEKDIKLDDYNGACCDLLSHLTHGKVISPKSLSDLLKLLKGYSFKNRNSGVIWRGQRDIDWRIDSSIARSALRADLFGQKSTAHDLRTRVDLFESQLLDESKKRGFHNGHKRELHDLELLALLQHHGASTRLIDFSYNFFVALWFAIGEEFFTRDGAADSNTGQSIGKDESFNLVIGLALDESNTYELKYVDREKSVGDTFQAYGDEKVYLFQPDYLLERMRAQQSVFAFSNIFDNKNHSLSCDYHEWDWGKSKIAEQSGMFSIAISDTLRVELYTYKIFENILGYSRTSLFPEIDSFAKSFQFKSQVVMGFGDYRVE